ncbi:aspartokinase [Bacteroidota bacterium]|nr:aspartokinase [Bacteroidota bacterium]
MRVYKFGGASIKDADGFRNVTRILQKESASDLIVVVSALGKTTNALEQVVDAYMNRTGEAHQLLAAVRSNHFNLMNALIPDHQHAVYESLNNTFVEIDWILEDEPTESYDYIYDQIVSIGEMTSTRMLAAYLQYSDIAIDWVDAREWIKTDNTYREGKINWPDTELHIQRGLADHKRMILTQGFIGCTTENFTTTLGREGSDYTAAIIAYCTDATSVTIWKDVPGVLNADPRYFKDTELIPELSYHEAIEMTYYGATVIHPKTIKPLQNKKIPLYVRSFINDQEPGTEVHEVMQKGSLPPVWVMKMNQTLISFSAKDFSFIAEDNLSDIFNTLYEYGIKVNLMQNSALSFSICVDDQPEKIIAMVQRLQQAFKVKINEHLHLLTVRHFEQEAIDRYLKSRQIYVEQRSRTTAQIVYA